MKVKKFVSKLKFILFAFALVCASIFAFSLHGNGLNVAASSEWKDVSSSLTNNGSFDSRTGSSAKVAQPNNFDANPSQVPKDDDEYVHGVIDLTETDANFENSFPDEHKYVLKLNGTQQHGLSFEYKTHNSMSLAQDSNYQISVDVYTTNSDGIAQLVLYDNDGKVISTINQISSKNNWSTCSFFISTNEFEGMNVKLGLSIDGEGVVLYDNLTAKQWSSRGLQTVVDASNGKTFKYLNKKEEAITELSLQNFFVKDVSASENGLEEYSSLSYVDFAMDEDAYDGNKTTALKIANSKSTFATYKTKNDLTFNQNEVLKLTITAKAVNVSGSATLKLVETKVEEGKTANESNTISISSASADNLLNGFVKYSFYVKASSIEDSTYSMVLNFGSAETSAKGAIYITSITLTNIDETIYSATDSNSVKLDLTANLNLDSAKYFDNGEFNFFQIEDKNNPFPAKANSWTVGVGNSEQKYGVVNTKADAFSAMVSNNKLSSIIKNPKPDKNENVLMMYNPTADTLIYTSTTKEIAGNIETGYHTIFVNLKAIESDVKLTLLNNNAGSEVELGSLTINSKPDTPWETAQIVVYNPYQTINVCLEISMSTKGCGACFIDDVTFDYDAKTKQTVALTKTNFDSLQDNISSCLKKIDLSNLFTKDAQGQAKFFVGDGTLDGYAKIIDCLTEELEDYLPKSTCEEFQFENFLKAKNFSNPNIIAIYAKEDTYYSLNANMGFAVDANSFYKLSVDVFTPALTSSNKDVKLEDLSVSLSLTNFVDNFEKIDAKQDWQTYTFYINPDNSTTAYISLALGNTITKCQGRIFLGNIQFEKFESEEDFNAEAKANKNTLVLKTVKEEENTEDENTTTENNKSGNNNWIYYVPSILFAVAIIICVVGVMMRKVKWKKPARKTKNDYDRNKTINKQFYARKATALREEKLTELNKELANLTNERAQYEEEYKHALTQMRELKIKRANATEIGKLEKEMKKNRKLSSAIGLNIQKLESEIEYTNTDAYLNSLIKKISAEKPQAKEDKPTETSNN